jgi:hypothetical protein
VDFPYTSHFFYFLEKELIFMARTPEAKFQAKLRKEIESMFPGSMTFKVDSIDRQGAPDLLVLYKGKWAALESKKDDHASFRPNQEYYIDILNKMSFARPICPENKQEVLRDLQQAFGT